MTGHGQWVATLTTVPWPEFVTDYKGVWLPPPLIARYWQRVSSMVLHIFLPPDRVVSSLASPGYPFLFGLSSFETTGYPFTQIIHTFHTYPYYSQWHPRIKSPGRERGVAGKRVTVLVPQRFCARKALPTSVPSSFALPSSICAYAARWHPHIGPETEQISHYVRQCQCTMSSEGPSDLLSNVWHGRKLGRPGARSIGALI